MALGRASHKAKKHRLLRRLETPELLLAQLISSSSNVEYPT